MSYSLSCIFMNMTNSYEKPDIQPEMVRLAQYAKQNVPEEHEYDKEEHLKLRYRIHKDSWDVKHKYFIN